MKIEMRELRKQSFEQYIHDSLKLPKIKGQNRNSWTLNHTHKKNLEMVAMDSERENKRVKHNRY